MITITLESHVAAKVEDLSTKLGKSFEESILEAVECRLERWNNEKRRKEFEAFDELHSQLKDQYLHQYVAIHNGKVVDVDENQNLLEVRVKEKYGDIAVLVMKVEEDLNYFVEVPRLKLRSNMKSVPWYGENPKRS